MKQIALFCSLLTPLLALATNPKFEGCDSQACNNEKLYKLQEKVLNSVKAQCGYILSDSIHLEFSVNNNGEVKIINEFSTSSMRPLNFAKKILTNAGDSLVPTSEQSYKWSWNIQLPEFTSSFANFYDIDNFPLVRECNTYNSKGKRACFQYLRYQAEEEAAYNHDEHMTIKLYVKQGEVVAATANHPPMAKTIIDRFILAFNEKMDQMTSYSSRMNSDDFWVEFDYKILGDSATQYSAYINRLNYLSTFKSKEIFHNELLEFKSKQFGNKPKDGAMFLVQQLVPLGLDSTTPYRIGKRTFKLDSLLYICEHGVEESIDTDESLSFLSVESVPVFDGCSEKDDNDKLKQCFQKNMLTYVAKHFKYPERARKKEIQGRIYVNFVVQKDGSIDDIRIVSGAHPLLDYESIRVVSEIPDLEKPAMQRGKPVRMSFTLPINAKLQ